MSGGSGAGQWKRAAAALLATVGAAHAWAEEKPLWELGAGFTVLQFPAYRGSDEDRLFVLPVPYVVYRGQFLKADRQGIRATFFDSDRAEVSLSLAASPPVSSDRVDAREGMPDLEPTVEIGPSLNLRLWRSADERVRLRTRLPLRAGFTLEGQPVSTGWQFIPQLNLDWRDPAGLNGWTLGMYAGPVYSDRRQHRYFYAVKPPEALPGRPAYDPDGGYAGTQMLAALWKRFPGWWVGGFVRYDSLAGAVFEDSPLVRKKDYFAAGFAVTWVFGESSQKVGADE
jgi:MipA family protein